MKTYSANSDSTNSDRTAQHAAAVILSSHPEMRAEGLHDGDRCPCADCEHDRADPTPAEALDDVTSYLANATKVLEVIRSEGRITPKAAWLLRDALDNAFF